MPDLKLDKDAIIATLGKELDRGIESLRYTAARLIDDVRIATDTLDGPMKVSIVDADAACVIDFHNQYAGTRDVQLQFSGGYGGNCTLMAPLAVGRYRAVILLNKIDEPK